MHKLSAMIVGGVRQAMIVRLVGLNSFRAFILIRGMGSGRLRLSLGIVRGLRGSRGRVRRCDRWRRSGVGMVVCEGRAWIAVYWLMVFYKIGGSRNRFAKAHGYGIWKML